MAILFRGSKNDTAEIRILPCAHLDFESAVTAQNDEFKTVFNLLVFTLDKRKKLSQESQYLASILSDNFITFFCRNILVVSLLHVNNEKNDDHWKRPQIRILCAAKINHVLQKYSQWN